MMGFTIEPYETENGKIPVDEFLDNLDIDHRAKVEHNLKRLEENGNRLRMPLSRRPLEDGIFELRTQFKDGISRICYFFFVGQKNNSHSWLYEKDRENSEKRNRYSNPI